MPRNRQHVPRDERVGALLTAASELFLARGYDGTTLTAVAEAAGLARGAVSWYFPGGKDALLAAALGHLLDVEAARVHALPTDPAGRLLAALDALQGHACLQATVHERAEVVAELRAFHQRLHAWLHDLAAAAVADDAGTDPLAADAVVACVEGALQSASERPASEIVGWVLARTRRAGPVTGPLVRRPRG